MWIISYRNDITWKNIQELSDYIWATGNTKKECEKDFKKRNPEQWEIYKNNHFNIYKV